MSAENPSLRPVAKSGLRVLILIVVPLLLIALLPIGSFRQNHLRLKTCLQSANYLRSGAVVRISGVEVGSAGGDIRRFRQSHREYAQRVTKKEHEAANGASNWEVASRNLRYDSETGSSQLQWASRPGDAGIRPASN